MKVSLIVAVASNGVIGKDNDLIWYLPRDLNYFKRTTQGHAVIMGRRNYESIPEKYRPLPGRTNIVVTRQNEYEAPGCKVVNSLESALALANEIDDDEPFIIGGGQIYKESLQENIVNRLYITEVHADFEGDTYFPCIDEDVWEEVTREHHPADARHAFAHSFVVYDKRA